jgi:hypothetical protein
MFADEEKDAEEQPMEEPSDEGSTEEAEDPEAATVVMTGREMHEALSASGVTEEEEAAEPEPSSTPTATEGWKTAKIPAAKPSQAASAKPAAPAPPAKRAEMMEESVGEASPSMAAADEKKSAGSFLSRFGIDDPNTQKWVLIGGIVVLALCCLCSCLAFVFGVLPSMGGGASSLF